MSSEVKRRRLVALVAVIVAAGALAFLAFSRIGEDLVYYWSPTELREAGDKAVGATVRLGGLVAPGSIQRHADALTLEFEVTDGDETVHVLARTVPPAMFREGIGVVVEGTLRPDGIFATTRLMIKHDNEYQPPGDEDSRDLKELMKTLQFEATGG